jgi:hypothetical protein
VLAISIRGDLKPVQKAFVDLRAKQAPFAMALALTRLAQGVKAVENELLADTFDSPTPFTNSAWTLQSATKTKPIAIVYPKDGTDTGAPESYLAPYFVGGPRSLGKKRGMLAPKNIGLNQYGNLTKGTLARLKRKPDVFVGTVNFRKGGKISGVWQRPKRGIRRDGDRGTKGNTQGKVDGVRTGLSLLIRFEDTTLAPKRIDFRGRAQRYLALNAAREFDAAMRKALQPRR